MGTGRNAIFYDRERVRSWRFVDQSGGMVEVARGKWGRLFPRDFEESGKGDGQGKGEKEGRVGFFKQDVMNEELLKLAREKGGFTSVVQTMGICSMKDPVLALRRLGELTRPGGRIFLLEHGRGYYSWINWILDRAARRHADRHGCWFNRDVGGVLEKSGLRLERVERRVLGTVWFVEARAQGVGAVGKGAVVEGEKGKEEGGEKGEEVKEEVKVEQSKDLEKKGWFSRGFG